MARPIRDAALADRRKPAIVTCRPLREGGMFDGPEEERLRILARAQALGAEFIDIEWDIGLSRSSRRAAGSGVIVSRHDFQGVPDELPGTAASGCARPAGKSRRSRSRWSARPIC